MPYNNNLTNAELLAILNTVRHNLDKVRVQLYQKVYVINAHAALHRAISEIEDRIRKTKDGRR